MSVELNRMAAKDSGGDGLRGEELHVPYPHGRYNGLPLHIILPDNGGTQDTLGFHESSSAGNTYEESPLGAASSRTTCHFFG